MRPFQRSARPVACFNPGASLDDNFKARFDQSRHDHGNQPHAPLTGITFSRNADNHNDIFLKTDARVRSSRHQRERQVCLGEAGILYRFPNDSTDSGKLFFGRSFLVLIWNHMSDDGPLQLGG